MEKKYKLTEITKQVEKSTLYRIQALKDFRNIKKGDLGGWIEKEENLSHEGDCWVSNNAWVSGDARVYGKEKIKIINNKIEKLDTLRYQEVQDKINEIIEWIDSKRD